MNNQNISAIYVSQSNGRDSLSGYTYKEDGLGNGPVKTLGRAMKMIKDMRVAGALQPISVKFIGDYFLDSSINVGSRFYDANFGDIPYGNVIFESAGQSRARIIGGRRLTGLVWDTVNGRRCFSVEIPEVASGELVFSDIYVNGRRATVSRFPHTGTLRGIDGEYPMDESPNYWPPGSKWFIAKKEDLVGIDSMDGAFVSICHQWVDDHMPVAAYDKESARIDFKYRSRYNMTYGYEARPDGEERTTDVRYCIRNIKEGMQEPDDWFLDKSRGKLYYIPRDEKMTPDNVELIIPTVKQLFCIEGTKRTPVENVRIVNLELFATDGTYVSTDPYRNNWFPDEHEFGSDIQSWYKAYGAIRFSYASRCSLEDCELHDTGIYGVEMLTGSQGVRVENCNMHNLGGGGVKIFGLPIDGEHKNEFEDLIELEDNERTCYNVIRSNVITHVGERYEAGCGVLVCHSSNNEIIDNEISYLEYSGISLGWIWAYRTNATFGTIVRGNHIHHILGNTLSDLGGIYCLGFQRGTVIDSNHIHDIKCNMFAASGIYTDQGASYITVTNNLVYRIDDNCYQHHYGVYNTVRNNIFAFADEAIVRLSLPESNTACIFNNNIMISDGRPMYRSSSSMEYPNEAASAAQNIYWDVSGEPKIFGLGWDHTDDSFARYISLEEMQKNFFAEQGSVVLDPEFADAKNFDFTLRDDSPVFQFDFQKLKF